MIKYFQIKPIKKEKRFFSAAIDLVLTILLGITIFEFLIFPLFSSQEYFRKCENESLTIRQKVTAIYKDSKTMLFDDDNNPLDNTIFLENFIGEVNDKKESCIEFFYLVYAKNNFDTYKEIDMEWLNKNIFGLPSADDEINKSYYFDYQKDEFHNRKYNERPVFNESNNFLTHLKNYIDGKFYEDSMNAFNNLKTWFTGKINNEINLITNTENFKQLNSDYEFYQIEISKSFSLASLSSFFLSGIIFYLLVPLILRGKTGGEYLLKIQTINTNSTKASALKISWRNMLRLFSLIGFASLMPIFKINIILCFTMVLFKIENFTLNMLTPFVFSILILLADLIFMIYNSQGKSFIGFITKTKTISSIDGEFEKKEEN